MPFSEAGFLALRDRAYAFLAKGGPADEPKLLAHVYGGPAPLALRAKLAAPLAGDPRLLRGPEGTWSVRAQTPASESFTALALVVSGPTPGRGRIVRISARCVQDRETLERFEVTVNPGKRVPRYVAARLGLEPAALDDLPPFIDVLEDLVRFLGTRPIFAQEARLSWAFVDAEARRVGRALAEPILVDANEASSTLLDLASKPTLALVAAHLGIGSLEIGRSDEEARILGLVGSRLRDKPGGAGVFSTASASGSATLRRGQTSRALADEPGVYVMRDAQQKPLYVGKARRLRSRMAAYVHRPLGPTRRLEGLVAAVDTVDTTTCATDLEALVLEDRQIRGLLPRFNTVRQQRTPRVWIRRPPWPPPTRGKRQPAAPRLELSLGPSKLDGDFVGPFRNEAAAQQARLLARKVFDLDRLRQNDREQYPRRLAQAWAFLNGDSAGAEDVARRHSSRLLRAVLAFDVRGQLLPADPRDARYAVVRPGPAGIEGFIVERGVLRGCTVLDEDDDTAQFAASLLAQVEPRTAPEDVDVVLRWLGAQRSPARLVCLPSERDAAVAAIEDAALRVLAGEARPAGLEDPLDALLDP
jgi:DNA polymerase III epsilon subunit-like protein